MRDTIATPMPRFGMLAAEGGHRLPLAVLRSGAGWYIGTADEEGPVTRESVDYYPTQAAGRAALESGNWIQREGN